MLEVKDVPGLLRYADEVIGTLRHPNGLFCFDRSIDSPELRGQSVRYSIIVLLGLLRGIGSGVESRTDVDGLLRVIQSRRSDLGVGDLGLLLWAEARKGSAGAEETVARLGERSAVHEHLDSLEGMEAAWFVIGTVHAAAAGLDVDALVDLSVSHLQTRRSPESALFRHTAVGRGRAMLPNFATEIYSLLALSEMAQHSIDADSLAHARELADTLIGLRQPNGGWPWLFHADRSVVAEPYEVYSVHQDSMAPMALFALTEVSGDDRYAAAAVESFRWCFGENELGFRFYDDANLFAHRSIRRSGSSQRLDLAINAALATLGLDHRLDAGGLAIETTCRPYHLGWILEAWSGREHMIELLGAS